MGFFLEGFPEAFLPPLPRASIVSLDCGLSSFSSMTLAAAVLVRGSSSTFPAPSSPPQHMETMARELEDCCPICTGSWEEASFVVSCLHQFCYPCILWWAESKPKCPLCKRRILSILHSVRTDDDFEDNAGSALQHREGRLGGHSYPIASSSDDTRMSWCTS
uniref:RING-type E3 ubiquitin transferase n=1 Tax=Calidris pygmaea TaxID=425635 RepID=A0A8C3JX33_9CHAR